MGNGVWEVRTGKNTGRRFIAAEMWSHFSGMMGGKPGCGAMFSGRELRK